MNTFNEFLYDVATRERERLFRLVADAAYDILKESGFKYGRKRIMNALLDNGLFEKLGFRGGSNGSIIPYIHPKAVIPVVDDITIEYPLHVMDSNGRVYGDIRKKISPSRIEDFSVTEVMDVFRKVLERDLKRVVGRRKYAFKTVRSTLKLSDLLSALNMSGGNMKKFGSRLEYIDGGETIYSIDIDKDPLEGKQLGIVYEPIFDEAKVIDNIISDRVTTGRKTYSRLSWKEALALVKDILSGKV